MSEYYAEFSCEDCGGDIIALGCHDGIPVCYVCRFIRGCPGMPEEVKAKLRGNDQPTGENKCTAH